MALLAAWLLFPACLLLVSLGLGLLVERACGRLLPGVLLAPAGFAAVLVVARLVTALDSTARLALPAVLVLAAAGYLLGFRRLLALRPDPWLVAAAVGVFLVFGAPTFLSGHPTFDGYTLLGDTSHQLALAYQYAHHGPDWQGLPDSATKLGLQKYITSSYPVAGQATLGVLAPLGVIDLAWLYQPFLTFIAALTCCGLMGLMAPWVRDRRLRAGAAFIAAQPSLAMAFALQGSIKEITTLAAIVLTAALVTYAVLERWPARALVALALPVVAALGALGPASLAFTAPLVAALVVHRAWLALRLGVRRLELAAGTAVLGLAVVLSLPILVNASTAYSVNKATLSNPNDLGNLARPLPFVEAFGVWLGNDYRYPPAHEAISYALSGMVIAALALGVLWAIRRSALGPLLFIGTIAIAAFYLIPRGSPYADAKVMMIASPAAVLGAMLGVAALASAARVLEATLLALLLAGAVLASSAIAYHNVQLAPYDRFHELSRIDDMLAGRGPVLFPEYDEFSKYFLRKDTPYAQPEWPHGYRPAVQLVQGPHRPSIKAPLDLDDLQVGYIESTPYVVLRRSPTATRPPWNFRRTFQGRYYDVWQRTPGTRSRVRWHTPLGRNVFEPSAVPRCSTVERLARFAGKLHGNLAYVPRPQMPFFITAAAKAPAAWQGYGAYPGSLVPVGQGEVAAGVRIPVGGTYRLWIEGSFGRRVSVSVDGRPAGSVQDEEGNPGQYLELDAIRMTRGVHDVRVLYGGGDLRPGNGGSGSSLRHIGPVAFSPPANESATVRYVAPRQARALCGQRLDWIEVLAP